MTQRKIKLNWVTDISKFANATSHCDFEIDLVSGRYVIDEYPLFVIY